MARARALVVSWLLLASACASAAGESGKSACEFVVTENRLSPVIPTVGVVEWSLSGGIPSRARIVYELRNADPSLLSRGGEAPVDLDQARYRTLLLGLKQASDYTFYIEAERDGTRCVSSEYDLPTTGRLSGSPSVGVEVVRSEARKGGFIVTSSGTSLPSSAFIIDADAEIVWYIEGPQDTTRALMDYEGRNMWLLALNLLNQGGEMRSVSMDGEEQHHDVPGLENAHHDFTVMPNGKLAAIAWSGPGIDPVSELLIRSPDGSITSAFEIGPNLYHSSSYHANAIHYVPFDDSFTISDRNPNALVKVSATGTPEWQLGGTCENAPTGNNCAPQEWKVNHGHHLLEDGRFLLFNNGQAEAARVLEFQLGADQNSLSATLIEDYVGSAWSTNLGDVQRLPGGNTLITYASDGKIVELDPDWKEVQTFSIRTGYSSWRPTLYGAPARP